MKEKNLNKRFKEAFNIASNTEIKLPPDIMLKFYAYYKQAHKGTNYSEPSGSVKLRNAFKLNAWLQLNHITEEEAKLEYINLVNNYLIDDKNNYI